jgi:GNAT superfamily N-acetyltransferase
MKHSIEAFNIRAFCPEDYSKIAAVHSSIFTEFPMTAAEMWRNDAERGPLCKHKYWVADRGTRTVAYGGFCQWPDTYAPGEFTLVGGVIPDLRDNGIGSALFGRTLAELMTIKTSVLRSHARADWTASVSFLKRRGFKEFMRERDWQLDVQQFDFASYRRLIESLESEGIVIRSLADLGNDSGRDRKLYDLAYELLKDTPGAELNTKLGFQEWTKLHIYNTRVPFDGYFVAVCDSRYIGKTSFETDEISETLQTKLTGVVKAFRRRKIATALKACAIGWAKENGHSRILTDNDSENHAMMALNEQLGFEKLPEWVFYEMKIQSSHADTNPHRQK